MVAKIVDPEKLASDIRQIIREEIAGNRKRLKLVGFLCGEHAPSRTYAEYTRLGCADVGIDFELRELNRLQVEEAIESANSDPEVHGIIIYYPIFGTGQDNYLKDLIDPSKDIEGLSTYWVKKLYHNERFIDLEKKRKSILPCTPLAIVKMLSKSAIPVVGDKPLRAKTITIFNRSEVVGRPLASMLANDGAFVYSFDLDGPIVFKNREMLETVVKRSGALAQSDIVITGVPSRKFPLVTAEEVKSGVICINFSTFRNFADDALEKASIFVPRVGPMTVTMALRNTLRLFNNYHKGP